ncbi:MAG: Yip1 family protein [Thermodesulfovibrionales bacterium]
MNIVERAKGIILKPTETWREIKEEQITIGELYKSYAVVLAAIPAIAQFIGSGLIGYSFMGTHIRMGLGSALGSAIVSYVMSLVSLYIVALIADSLAPSFGSSRNITNAFKAVCYSITPTWVAGVLYIFPPLSVLVIIAGLYGIYLFYLGLPLLMETPKEKALGYVIVVIVITIVIYVAIGFITGMVFMSGPMGRGMMTG